MMHHFVLINTTKTDTVCPGGLPQGTYALAGSPAATLANDAALGWALGVGTAVYLVGTAVLVLIGCGAAVLGGDAIGQVGEHIEEGTERPPAVPPEMAERLAEDGTLGFGLRRVGGGLRPHGECAGRRVDGLLELVGVAVGQ